MVPPQAPLLVIALVAFASLGLPDGILGVAWPSLRADHAVSHSALGSILGASMAGYLASSVSSGALVARWGIGPLLAASGLLMVLATAAIAATPAFGAVVAAGLLGGLGAGAIDAGINAFAARRFSARVLNWLHAGYAAGALAGPAVMTRCIASGGDGGYRKGYALVAALLAAMTLAFVATLARWSAGAPPAGRGAPAEAGPLAALRSRAVVANVAIFAAYAGLEATAGQWTYTLLSEGRGLPMPLAGWGVALFWAGLTGGRVVFGAARLAARSEALLRLSIRLAPLGALGIAADAGVAVTFAALLLLGLALAPIYPLLVATTPDRLGPRLGASAIGLEVSGAYLGAAAIPAATGALAARFGIGAAAPAAIVASSLLLLLLARAAPPAGAADRLPALPAPEDAG